jgi:hypothetical protein
MACHRSLMRCACSRSKRSGRLLRSGSGGRVVYATEEHASLAPPELPVGPDWSPVAHYGGYTKASKTLVGASHSAFRKNSEMTRAEEGPNGHVRVFGKSGLWSLGCHCFAF